MAVLIAGVLSLVLAGPRQHTQPSNGRIFAEAFGITLMAIPFDRTAWGIVWRLEHRW